MSKKIAAFDIETIARPLSDNMLAAFCKTGNLKDPKKIAAKKAEARLGLGKNPLTAVPCCGGWYADEENCGYIMLKNNSPEAEKAFLEEYLGKLSEFDLLISYNGIGFDSRILLLRACVHGIDVPFKIDRKKYSTTGNHVDLYSILTDWAAFGQGSLDFFLSMMGLQNKTEGIDGSMIQGMWDNQQHDEIGRYNLQDCKVTMELYQKIAPYFL